MVATPGISSGYWQERKRRRAARTSAGNASMCSPSSSTCPCVTTYSPWPASTCARVDLAEPFGPISACTLPRPTESSSTLSIFLPSTSTCRFRTSKRFILSHAAFQADRDQLLRLDGEFHRQLLQHVLDEAIDHQRHRLLLRQAPLLAIEQRVLGNLRGGGLVLEYGGRVLRLDIRHGMSAAPAADQERDATGETARAFGPPTRHPQATVGSVGAPGRRALGASPVCCVLAEMEHFRAGIDLLVTIGNRD